MLGLQNKPNLCGCQYNEVSVFMIVKTLFFPVNLGWTGVHTAFGMFKIGQVNNKPLSAIHELHIHIIKLSESILIRNKA